MKLRYWVVLTFVWLMIAACNRAPAPTYSPKQVPLAHEAMELTHLEIIQYDRQSGERWTALLARSSSDPDSKEWKIESSPRGELSDRIAAGGLIHHLLDTFTTLQIKEVAPKGTLESFGLAPPQMGLKLLGKSPKEIRIGALVSHAGAERGTRYAVLPPDPTVYVVEGAALQMLDYINSFNTLRQQSWLNDLSADDIDEIEILEGPKGKKSLFYAQREGAIWTDRKHKPISRARGDTQALLDHLAHARMQEFVDDPKVNQEIMTALGKRPGMRLQLTHRDGKKRTQASLGWVVVSGIEGAYGTVDSRGDLAFRLHSETLRLVEKFSK